MNNLDNILNDTKEIKLETLDLSNNNNNIQEIDLSKDIDLSGLEILNLDNNTKSSNLLDNITSNNPMNNNNNTSLPTNNTSLSTNNNTSLPTSNKLTTDIINLDNLNDINIPELDSPKQNNINNNKSSIDLGLDLLTNQNKKKTSSSDNILNNSINVEKTNNILNNSSINVEKTDNILNKSEPNLVKSNIDILNNSGTKITNSTTSMLNNSSTNNNNKPSLPNVLPNTTNIESNEEVNEKEKPINKMSPQEILQEKTEILAYFDRLEKRGVRIVKRFNLSSNLEDMRFEKRRIIEEREAENSIKFQRKMLMAFTTGVEFLNNRYDPFDIKLEGWSESVHENINDYDEVFEELHEKYKEKTHIAPELKLMLMMGGSAFMFHITNTMFKSSLPGMNDIMQQNPELMKQFASAAMNQMSQNSPGFSNLMNDVNPNMMGGGGPPPNMMGGGGPPPNMMGGGGPPPQNFRRDMEGPKGVDDILAQLHTSNNLNGNQLNISDSEINDINTLENVRNIELDSNKNRNKNIKKSSNSITLDL